jgi:hypothetical protein
MGLFFARHFGKANSFVGKGKEIRPANPLTRLPSTVKAGLNTLSFYINIYKITCLLCK